MRAIPGTGTIQPRAEGPPGDYQIAERRLRRHVADDLVLSCVPSAAQRLWRTMTHSQYQLTRDRVRIHSQIDRGWKMRTSSWPRW